MTADQEGGFNREPDTLPTAWDWFDTLPVPDCCTMQIGQRRDGEVPELYFQWPVPAQLFWSPGNGTYKGGPRLTLWLPLECRNRFAEWVAHRVVWWGSGQSHQPRNGGFREVCTMLDRVVISDMGMINIRRGQSKIHGVRGSGLFTRYQWELRKHQLNPPGKPWETRPNKLPPIDVSKIEFRLDDQGD